MRTRYPAQVTPILFDLDGTLIDSLPDIAAATNTVLQERGLPTHDLSTVRGFVGHGLADLVRCAIPPEADFEAILAAVHSTYEQGAVGGTLIYPGVQALLDELKGRGWPLAVLTNKPHSIAVKVVERLFGTSMFVRIIGEGPVPKKPDTTGARTILREIEPIEKRPVMVGDSPVDVQTARAAGMHAVAVTWGYTDRDRLVAASPDALVDSAEQLLEQLVAFGD